jgi:alpha-tubulin suppressor-like RCC1 family protein
VCSQCPVNTYSMQDGATSELNCTACRAGTYSSIPGTSRINSCLPKAQVHAQESHTCAKVDSGKAFCWGSGADGRLGYGDVVSRSIPERVQGLSSSPVMVTTGGAHSCALLSSGSVQCWGKGDYGQLGNGSLIAAQLLPISVVGINNNATHVSTGGAHTCAVLRTGQVRCWGRGDSGQMGNGGTVLRNPSPVTVTGISGAVDVSC